MGAPAVAGWCTTTVLLGLELAVVSSPARGQVWLMVVIRLLQLPGMALPGEWAYTRAPVWFHLHPRPGFPNIWHNS